MGVGVDELDVHPLAYLLRANRWSALQYLTRLDAMHQHLGFGALTVKDRKRVTRWIRHGVVPEHTVQLAMAAIHRVPKAEVTARSWPHWLTLACVSNQDLLNAPWNPHTATQLLDYVATVGGQMDRRAFLVVGGLAPVLAQAATAPTATATATAGRRIGADVPELFEKSLALLRRQDDQFGSGQVHTAARAQLRLITHTLADASYTEAVSRRLYSCAAEAARICGWTAYDSGRHALAEEFYVTALRAAASAGDPVVTANTLAFWAIQRYSTGDPHGAADLTNHALTHGRTVGSPRLRAMLHARAARAHAKAGDHRASARSQNAAIDAYDRTRSQDPAEEPDCVYWVNLGELRMLSGSCALNLGRPADALSQFEAATAELRDAYREDAFPRGAAIYLAREAEARIALDDLDGAVDTAHRAVTHMGGVTSARGSSTLTDLRSKLVGHHQVPVVADFLDRTA